MARNLLLSAVAVLTLYGSVQAAPPASGTQDAEAAAAAAWAYQRAKAAALANSGDAPAFPDPVKPAPTIRRPSYADVMKRVEAGERVRITLPGEYHDAPLWYVGTYDCWMDDGRPVMKEVWSGKSAPGVADPPLPFPLTGSRPTTSGTNAQEVGVVVASLRSIQPTVTVPTITPAGDVVLPGGTSYYCPPWG